MVIIDGLVINVILLLFPLTIYSIYISYLATFNKEEKNSYLDFAIISSLFLMIRYGAADYSIRSLLLINVPLLIAYLKNRKKLSILVSIILIIYNKMFLNISLYFTFIEYSLYFLIYVIVKKKKINISTFMNIFISIKSFVLSSEFFFIISPNSNFFVSILYLTLLVVIFIYGTNIILSLIRKGDSMIEFTNTIKELNRQKALKLSLFKLAHEVKNPISVCKGYLEMIDYKDQDKLKKYISIINSEIKRTLMIINDFSDYGKIKIEKEEVDLVVLIEDIYSTLFSLLKKNEIDLEINCDYEELYMELDYDRIKQVLINVLKNSIEAKKKNEKLKICLDVKSTKKSIKIIINDNGVGMDRETLQKMSEIFYTTKHNGSGLGVALSREIIELHGGNMNYKSTLGKGTTVTIKLSKN